MKHRLFAFILFSIIFYEFHTFINLCDFVQFKIDYLIKDKLVSLLKKFWGIYEWFLLKKLLIKLEIIKNSIIRKKLETKSVKVC
jgi:hypothetical protein